MPIDRGGLDYRIRIEDQFSRNLGKFVSGVKVARSEWKGLRSDLERPITASGVVQESDRTTTSLQRQRRASRDLERQKARETRQQQNNRRAIEQQNRAARQKEQADRRGIIANRQAFTVERRLVSVQEQNRRAVEAVTRARDKSNQIAARQRVVSRENIRLTTRERRELGLLTRAEERQIRTKRERTSAVDRLRRANRVASNERLTQLRAETIAQERINRARQQELVNAALSRRGRADLISGAAGTTQRPTETQVGTFQRLARAIRGSDEAANRASFTFRRLFGILAAFTIAREAVAGFVSIVRALVETSAAIEAAEVGLAGLITATTELRDLEGTVVGAEEGIAIAGQEARRQIRLLRLEALNTTASFTELLDAFQVGLAPGIQAGLNLDEVREFTVLISQAAAALGLEQRQLAEEIRSILSGTINIRQTRIAAALGLTNAEIRRAKETGDLIGFLRGELEAFRVAGREAARTLTGLRRRVSDAFTQTLEAGGIGFVEALKTALSDILDTLVNINEETQTIELNPDLVGAVEELSDGLTRSVEELRRIGEELDPETIQNFAGAIGDLLAFLSAIVADITIGIVRAVEILRIGFSALSGIIRSIPGLDEIIDSGILRSITVNLTVLITGFIALGAAIGALRAVAVFSLSALAGILNVAIRLGGAVATLGRAVTALIPGLAAMRASLLTSVGIAASFAAALLAVVFAITQLTGATQFDISRTGFINELTRVVDLIEAYAKGVPEVFKLITDPENADLGSVEDNILQAQEDFRLRLQEQEKFVDAFKRELTELPEELARALGKAVDLSESSFEEILGDLRNTEAIEGLVLPISNAFDQLIEKINDLSKAYEAFQDRQIDGAVQFEIESGGFVNNLTNLFETAARDIRNLSEESVRALDSLESRLDTAEEILGSTIDPEQASIQRALITGLIDQAERLRALQAGARAARLGLLADEVAESLRLENVRRNIAVAESQIELARERALILAEREGDTVGATLANLRAERALLALEEQDRVRIFDEQNERLRTQLELLIRQRSEILASQGELSATEQQALDRINAAVDGYQTQLDLLQQQNEVLREQASLRDQELERQQQINEFAREQPILAGLAVEAYGRLNELSNVFLQTQRFLGRAIEEFAQTASQLIVDIFDPTTDADIKERFGRFLQSIAQQIISTLISLAVTAAILNAASGGLLGPLLQGFVQGPLGFTGGFGFHEGGKVDRGTASRARAHPAHMRAEGLASGGASRARPKGLHPKDTVPIWTAVGEWVIKAKSVAKAGNDAMARLNAGAFDRGMLRLAVGLPASPTSRAVSTHSAGPGYIAGGRVTPSASQSAGGAEQVVVAPVIISTEDAVRDLLSGGKGALIEAMEEAGFQR